MQINYNLYTKIDNAIWCVASSQEVEEICICKVYMDNKHKVWTISSWYTKEEYKNKGIGKKTLAKIINHLYVVYGKPEKIEYVWNGTNEYVYDWMVKHFDAVCKCPIWVQKTQTEDDWESHVYVLDVDKVLEYFETI